MRATFLIAVIVGTCLPASGAWASAPTWTRHSVDASAPSDALACDAARKKAAGQYLAALTLCATLVACGEGPNAGGDSETAALEDLLDENIVRTADCNGTGTIANLDSEDDFVTIFTGPSVTFPPKRRAEAGVLMHLCTPSKDERYVGIIYQYDGELPDLEQCKFTTDPVPRYEAPCGSGWVKASDLESGRISASYAERGETKAADREGATGPREDMAAIDRLSDRLNGQFPISKHAGYVMNYRSLGTGCQAFIRNEIYQQGDTLDHSARFDFSEIASVGEIYQNTNAEPGIFQFSLQLTPDETGSPRVKIKASRDGYDTSPRNSIELGLLSRESAEEARETLLQLKSLCRALGRNEQASAERGLHRSSRASDLRFAGASPPPLSIGEPNVGSFG